MKSQKGFIQIPLLVIVIVSIIVASVGTGVVLQKQEKLAPFIANISEMFKGTEGTTIIQEKAVKSEEPQVEQEPEPKEEEIVQEAKKAETQAEEAQIRAEQAELEAENLKQQAEAAKEEVEKARLLAEAEKTKAEAEKAKAEAERLRKEAEEAERLIQEKLLEISSCEGIECPSCQYCIEGKCLNRPDGYNDCGSGCQRCINGSCQNHNAACPNCQYCSSDTCVNYCEGTNTSCGCTNCANCNNLDGWVDMGVPYSCCDGDKACTCQKQEYRDYSCLGASCNSIVTNTRVNKSNCAECSSSESCLNGACQSNCAGTDTSCGSISCINCNASDRCSGDSYLDYYCSGTSCIYTSDDCSDCSCSCGGYNFEESVANGNCNDGKDNDCDGTTDLEDLGCLPAGTKVGGIISSDTIWTKENSPYTIIDILQILPGATLTIKPGVIVNGNNIPIQVGGKLYAIGEKNSKMIFNNIKISGIGTTQEHFEINLQFAEINSGPFYYWPDTNYGSLTLRDSKIQNSSFIYLWYPTADCFIERNIFLNTGGISVGTSNNVKVYIQNNVFYNQHNWQGDSAVEAWASYGTSEIIVRYNSFLSTDRVALHLPVGYSTANMTAINNYWNTTDDSVIESMIFDKNDDLRSANYINYLPILTEPHLDTPKP